MLINYPSLIDDISTKGLDIESRIGRSRELIGRQVQFFPGTMVWRPGFNRALGFMELIQLIAGIYDPEQISRVAPSAIMGYFSTVSAYGPRLYHTDVPDDGWGVPEVDNTHFHRVIKELGTSNTRRAVLFIAKSTDQADDLACTLTFQLLVRNSRLYGVVSMRSWDVIRGLPYDIMMFGGLLQAIAHVLRLELGHVTVTAGSLHLYLSDVDLIPQENKQTNFTLKLSHDVSWSGLRMMCKNQVRNFEKTPYFVEVAPWRLVSDNERP